MKVFCFSGSGYSRQIADCLSQRLKTAVTDIDKNTDACADTAVVVFPVYCQNIPEPVKVFLKKIQADNIALVACYGGIHYGNVIFDASKLTAAHIICAACVPTGHSLLGEEKTFALSDADMLARRILSPETVDIRKERKSFFADIFPAWRSRAGIRVHKTGSCNGCGVCASVCPMGAVKNGEMNRYCIRCMRCVTQCPNKALETSLTPSMKLYFKTHKKRKHDITFF